MRWAVIIRAALLIILSRAKSYWGRSGSVYNRLLSLASLPCDSASGRGVDDWNLPCHANGEAGVARQHTRDIITVRLQGVPAG
jgi:hypothetical protein